MANLNTLIAMGPVSPALAPTTKELLALAQEIWEGVLLETGTFRVLRKRRLVVPSSVHRPC